MDPENRGYMHLSLTPQAVRNDWIFLESVRKASLAVKPGKTMQVRAGRRMLESA